MCILFLISFEITMIYTTTEIKEITEKFLSKHSKQLECKKYGYGEMVRREGDNNPKLYIIK